MDEDMLRAGIRRTAWKWARSTARRSEQLGHSDPEFCLYLRDELQSRLKAVGATGRRKPIEDGVA